MLRSLRAWRHPFGALILMLMVAAGVFCALWIYTLYRVRVDVGVLQVSLEAHMKDHAVREAAWRAEFDEIYRTLYAPPPPPATADTEPKRRPSSVELWQVNRDTELRARIQALEQWRLHTTEKR